MQTLHSFVYESIFMILTCFLLIARVLESVSNLTPHHCCLFIGLFLSFCVFCVSISNEISPHDVIPHGAAAIVPVKLGVMYVMVDRALIIPVTKSPVTLKREDNQANGKSTKHVERSDQGHDWCGGEVDSRLKPVHGEARERVRVVGLMVDLVDTLVKPGGVEQAVCPVEVEICPDILDHSSYYVDSYRHLAALLKMAGT